MTNKKNEVAINENANELTFSAEDADLMAMMAADAITCVDQVDKDDMIIPRIALVQALSSVLKKNDAKYIPEAEAGCMVEILTQNVIKGDEGFLFVPAKVVITYVEWADRKSGGGILNNYGLDASAYAAAERNEKGGRIGSQPNSEIIKTYNLYGHIYRPESSEYSQIWIPMSKSQAKVAQKLITLMLMRKDPNGNPLPAFSCCYRITAVQEGNKKGDVWFGFSMDFFDYTLKLPQIGLQLYKASKDLYKVLTDKAPTAFVAEDLETEDLV